MVSRPKSGSVLFWMGSRGRWVTRSGKKSELGVDIKGWGPLCVFAPRLSHQSRHQHPNSQKKSLPKLRENRSHVGKTIIFSFNYFIKYITYYLHIVQYKKRNRIAGGDFGCPTKSAALNKFQLSSEKSAPSFLTQNWGQILSQRACNSQQARCIFILSVHFCIPPLLVGQVRSAAHPWNFHFLSEQEEGEQQNDDNSLRSVTCRLRRR